MNNNTGGPLDTLNTDALNWAKSIGSKAKTITEIVNSRDPLVSYNFTCRILEKKSSNAICAHTYARYIKIS